MPADMGKLIDVLNDVTQALNHETITPGTSVLKEYKALYVTVTGDVVVEDSLGTTITYPAVPVGLWPGFRPTKIKAGTTATVVGWYGNQT